MLKSINKEICEKLSDKFKELKNGESKNNKLFSENQLMKSEVEKLETNLRKLTEKYKLSKLNKTELANQSSQKIK